MNSLRQGRPGHDGAPLEAVGGRSADAPNLLEVIAVREAVAVGLATGQRRKEIAAGLVSDSSRYRGIVASRARHWPRSYRSRPMEATETRQQQRIGAKSLLPRSRTFLFLNSAYVHFERRRSVPKGSKNRPDSADRKPNVQTISTSWMSKVRSSPAKGWLASSVTLDSETSATVTITVSPSG